MIINEIANKLHLSLDYNVTGIKRRVRPISLREFLNALIDNETAVAAAPVLGISRATLSDIGKELFPEKQSKQHWSTFLYSVISKKKCSKCQSVLSIDSFRDDKSKGKHTMCEPCLSAYGKQRYYEDKPKHQEWLKNWRKNNPSKVAESSARRRANKLAQTPESADLKLISIIYKHCPSDWHVDHIIPLNKGGLHHQNNLCYLWGPDNMSKGDKMPEDVPEIMARAIFPLYEDGGFL